jgi:DnaJ-class molecular chaperone
MFKDEMKNKMVKDATLYDRLGVSSDASENQIKKAYIQLSKQWHPDKHPEEMKEEAGKKFKEITEAKDILSDGEKRRQYDQIGMDILKQGGGEGNPFNPFGDGFPGFPGGFPGFPPGFPFGNMNVNVNRRVLRPIETEVTVTLEQVYKEEPIEVSFLFQKDCSTCNGEGGQTDHCGSCNGKGKQMRIQQMGPMITQSIIDCGQCEGKGRVIREKCKKCTKGIVERTKKIVIPLSKDLVPGNKINVKNQGHIQGDSVSDVVISVNILPHSLFIQRNHDLVVNVELTLLEALFGFSKTIKNLDNSDIVLESTVKTDYNHVQCMNNKGMNQHGNLYIVYTISIPTLEKGDYYEILKDILPVTSLSGRKKMDQTTKDIIGCL